VIGVAAASHETLIAHVVTIVSKRSGVTPAKAMVTKSVLSSGLGELHGNDFETTSAVTKNPASETKRQEAMTPAACGRVASVTV
jgi:hypothetical protein